jgi:Tol biopolymer transport system component
LARCRHKCAISRPAEFCSRERALANPGSYAIYVSDADGSREQSLVTSDTLDYNPAWSPDGRWIVFTSERDGSPDLYKVDLNTSRVTRLTDHAAYDDQATVSPDGTRIVFVSTRDGGTANLWTLDLSSNQARPLTSGPGGDFRPAWSPDGAWIAFSSDRTSSMPMGRGRWEHLDIQDVYVIRPNGADLRRYKNDGYSCGSPKWSPDSRRLVAYCLANEDTLPYRASPANGDSQLVSIDIERGEIQKVQADSGIKIAPTILPNGDIAFVRRNSGRQGIFYTNGKTGPTGDVRYGAWSADGKRVAYTKRTVVTRTGWRKAWSRDPRYELIRTQNMPSFHPTGDRFVTQGVAPAGPLGRGINVIESVSGASRILFQQEGKHALAPQWSPRGDSIVFGLGTFTLFTGGLTPQIVKPEDRVDGGAQVAIINSDGSGFRELTKGPNNSGFPSISADGKRVVYRTFGPEGNGLRIFNLDDRSITTLTTEYDNFPFWSPRGDLIMFSRTVSGDFEIFTIRPDGSGLRRLTSARGNDAHMGWSPDGEWIVFSSSRMGFKDESLYTTAPQPYGDLFVMKKDGTDVRQLTDNQWEDGAPAWQPSR